MIYFFIIPLLLMFLFIPFCQNINENLIIILTISYPTIFNPQKQLLIDQTILNLSSKLQNKLRVNPKDKLIHFKLRIFYHPTSISNNLEQIRQYGSEDEHLNDTIHKLCIWNAEKHQCGIY